MHRRDALTEELTSAVIDYAVQRMRMHPPPLDHGRTLAELRASAGKAITAPGLGGHEALRLFAEVLAPACISVDHPLFLSFVPAAPTEASILFDLVVGASNVYAGSWMEGSGAIFAENQALRYVADLAGLPAEVGGVFVSGGTAGNLSALLAARWRWRQRAAGRFDRTRGVILASAGAHSSIGSAARAMDADVVGIPVDGSGRLCAAAARLIVDALSEVDRRRVFAVVGTAGTTNAGVIDELDGLADLAAVEGFWFHVDAAYGGAALAAPSVRARFVGIERADSLILDPHKWLFAPFDCCALVYRDPHEARRAHTQHAEYLDVLHAGADDSSEEWNASDLAHHLSRRARGLPLWFSLVTHGTDAYRQAVETTLATARRVADLVRGAPHLELILEPELTVVMFRRHGWVAEDYQRWSARLLAAGVAFVVPSSWQGETVLRLCIVNPLTTAEQVGEMLDTLR
jgi:L-2,4-diaminobutyrate decarboxylase